MVGVGNRFQAVVTNIVMHGLDGLLGFVGAIFGGT
jgi:hypothetical protein